MFKNMKVTVIWKVVERCTILGLSRIRKVGSIYKHHNYSIVKFSFTSGWIHAVYTPEDSLVFGGNYLHSFSIEKQIRVAQIEEITKVPQKFRYPFFTELQWFALDKYVYSLFGRTHLDLNDDEQDFLLGEMEERKEFYAALDKTHRHITPQVC